MHYQTHWNILLFCQGKGGIWWSEVTILFDLKDGNENFLQRIVNGETLLVLGSNKIGEILKESTKEDYYITNQYNESIMICSENIKLYLDQLELHK